MGGALHGDKVRVRIRARSARGAEGEVVAVVERGIKRVAGTLHRRARARGSSRTTRACADPSSCRGPSTRAGSDGNSGNDGDAVVVAITRWPESPDENPEGRIEAVLGRPGRALGRGRQDPRARGHRRAALRAGRRRGRGLRRRGPRGDEGRARGPAHLPLPTIDPEDARDHDDAVWVERTDGGGYRAWIAIADVSTYVTPGTAIDDEAKARGCSVYLPDRAIPMLPRALSSNLCSLLPDVDRLCLCVEVELDAGGQRASRAASCAASCDREPSSRTAASRARSACRAEARREPEADAMVDGLRVAYELSRALRAQRMKRGALDFDLPEAKVDPPRRDARADRRRAARRGSRASARPISSSRS